MTNPTFFVHCQVFSHCRAAVADRRDAMFGGRQCRRKRRGRFGRDLDTAPNCAWQSEALFAGTVFADYLLAALQRGACGLSPKNLARNTVE